ncbi:MAG: acyltransferase [Herbaspirillum sp.]|jgi:peptidoglycan/LPS O-acetylase OafA/YrhL|nr:acyltransferase [Herbaspirillum sp.]
MHNAHHGRESWVTRRVEGYKNFIGGSPTVGSIMDAHRGAGPGFDALRIGLAIAITFWHCFQLSIGLAIIPLTLGSPFQPIVLALVPLFFCLSGFLITGSAIRTNSIRVFIANRGIRIVPALAVEVALSAFVLGPLVTTLPLSEYFASPITWRYFGNIIGHITYTLPGVFKHNILPNTVNGNLWTLAPEYYCYLMMVGLMATRIVFNRKVFSMLMLVAVVGLSVVNALTGRGSGELNFASFTITYYFFVGITLYHWRYFIPVKFSLFVVCAGIAYFLLPYRGTFILAFPVAYCMAYIGMLKIPPIPLLKHGDYSYGIYLFSYPIMQMISHFYPGQITWYTLLLIALPSIMLFAALSWHLFEKPALRLKKHLVAKPKPGIAAMPAL